MTATVVKTAKTSQRTCIACREIAARQDLLRFTVGGTEEKPQICFDKTRRRPGRGVWVHSPADRPDCFEAAIEKGLLARGLRAPKSALTEGYAKTLREGVARYISTD